MISRLLKSSSKSTDIHGWNSRTKESQSGQPLITRLERFVAECAAVNTALKAEGEESRLALKAEHLCTFADDCKGYNCNPRQYRLEGKRSSVNQRFQWRMLSGPEDWEALLRRRNSDLVLLLLFRILLS